MILAAWIIVSCHNDNPTIPSGKLKINSLSSDSLAVGDTLVLKGEFFGIPSSNKRLVFDSTLSIGSQDCMRWHNFEIRFVVPKGAKDGFLKLVESGEVLDSVFIKISAVPFFDVIEVPAGKFIRGSLTSSVNEQPAREITISKPFYISKYEVSQRLFEAVTGNNPSNVVSLELPVGKVTWVEAAIFCNELSKIHSLDEVYIITGVDAVMNINKNGWRLPTEAEWEYACRAGTTGDYAGNGILDDMGWYGYNSGLKMHPPARKLPNDFGIYDMHGNVWEWCWDFFSSNYYAVSPDTDPIGPEKGERRIMRGGSWNDGMNFARSSNRTIPLQDIGNVGIRLVRNKDN